MTGSPSLCCCICRQRVSECVRDVEKKNATFSYKMFVICRFFRTFAFQKIMTDDIVVKKNDRKTGKKT